MEVLEKLTENNSNAPTWFTKKYDYDLNKYSYYGNIINTEFDEWINENIKLVYNIQLIR